jgi:hypothetical protein
MTDAVERDEAVAEAITSGRSLRLVKRDFSLTETELDAMRPSRPAELVVASRDGCTGVTLDRRSERRAAGSCHRRKFTVIVSGSRVSLQARA